MKTLTHYLLISQYFSPTLSYQQLTDHNWINHLLLANLKEAWNSHFIAPTNANYDKLRHTPRCKTNQYNLSSLGNIIYCNAKIFHSYVFQHGVEAAKIWGRFGVVTISLLKTTLIKPEDIQVFNCHTKKVTTQMKLLMDTFMTWQCHHYDISCKRNTKLWPLKRS